MLSYLNSVFLLGSKRMSQSEVVSSKSRRKKIDVPIHNTYPEKKYETQKIFSANFNSRKKHKNVEFENNFTQLKEVENSRENHNQDNVHNKLNRKELNREIDRLRIENLQLIEQLNNNESVAIKKVAKLRDKLNAMYNNNNQIANENQILRGQYEQLFKVSEDLRMQLEEARNCKSCEDLKIALDNSGKDYDLLRATNKELLEDIDMLKNVVYR